MCLGMWTGSECPCSWNMWPPYSGVWVIRLESITYENIS